MPQFIKQKLRKRCAVADGVSTSKAKSGYGFLSRRAIEAVEVALTLPILTLALFGTAEITHRWHKEKLLRVTAYEALKAGAAKDGNSDAALAVFNEQAAALGINSPVLVFYPSKTKFDEAEAGDTISVRAYAKLNKNKPITPMVLVNLGNINGGRVHYFKEGL